MPFALGAPQSLGNFDGFDLVPGHLYDHVADVFFVRYQATLAGAKVGTPIVQPLTRAAIFAAAGATPRLQLLNALATQLGLVGTAT